MTAISTPIFFLATGLAMAEGLKLVNAQPDPHSTKLIAEVTLVWVLFADASRVRFSALQTDFGRYLRLLALGLPLTIAFERRQPPLCWMSVPGTRCCWVPPWRRLMQLLARRSCQTGVFQLECGRRSTWKVD